MPLSNLSAVSLKMCIRMYTSLYLMTPDTFAEKGTLKKKQVWEWGTEVDHELSFTNVKFQMPMRSCLAGS